MRQLIIDGTNLLTEYGVWINGDNVLAGAEADIETVKIPGRSGDLVYSNKRFNNFSLTYQAAIPRRFMESFNALRAFLYSDIGYRQIEDSYFPEMFRSGRISGTIDPSNILWSNDAGLFSITFDCKPQHYYKAGQTASVFTANGSITNPTLFDALPLIRVYGAGSFTLNNTPVTVAAHNYAYMDIDCEIMDAFNGDANLNSFVTVSGDQFPKLRPGTNALTKGSGISKIEIKPRYWTL